MVFNLKRIIFLSFFNHFLKKSIRSLDYKMFDSKLIDGNITYSCSGCQSVFSSVFFNKNPSSCPMCNSKLLHSDDSFNI